MMTPVIKAIALKYPESDLFVAVRRKGIKKDPYYTVLKNLPFIKEVVESKHINKKDYDLFFDLTKSCAVYEKPGLFLNRIDLFASSCNVELESKTPIYLPVIKERLEEPTIALHIKSEDVKRDWSLKNNISLIHLILRNTKLNILILDHDVEELIEHSRVRYCRGLNIEEAAGLLSQCKYFLGPDSCFMHFAAAFNIPSLILMGSIPVEARLKYYEKARALTANISCLGCWYTECDKDIECMKLLDPGTVFKHLEGLIDEEA